MTITVDIPQEVNITTLEVHVTPRYWEDSHVNGFEDTHGDLIPCRKDDYWKPIIEIDTGKIINWKQGVVASIHYKVADKCGYTLKDEKGSVVKTYIDYVPSCMCPKEEGYGEYVIMDILEDGTIDNWNPDLEEFFED